MKSRLLPPPIADEHEFVRETPPADYARRDSDSAAKGIAPATQASMAKGATPDRQISSAASTETPTTTTVVRPAPQVSARPQGRFVVVGILLACVGSMSYFVWSTFLRDAAYGIVSGEVTDISPPWPGTLTDIHVRAGEVVEQGQLLAVIDDPELQASIDQLGDNLRAAQADLDAQAALVALAARDRGNKSEASRAHYYDLRGELLTEQSRHEEISSKLKRRQELAGSRAYSGEEIESLRFVQQGLAAKIENLQQAVAALETQTERLPADDYNTAQLKPWLARIENYQAEIHRLRDKQRRGMLRAPRNGTVVEVSGHVGERATPTKALLEFLPAGTLEIVLYVKQQEANAYQIGQQAKVIVEPAPEPIVCRVTRIGQRLEKPQTHVAGRYRPEEKLLPLYLAPVEPLPVDHALRLGSTVRLPATLFGSSR